MAEQQWDVHEYEYCYSVNKKGKNHNDRWYVKE